MSCQNNHKEDKWKINTFIKLKLHFIFYYNNISYVYNIFVLYQLDSDLDAGDYINNNIIIICIFSLCHLY